MATAAASTLRRLQAALKAAASSAKLAKAADAAGDAAGHFRKVNSSLDDIAGILRQSPDMKGQLHRAIRSSPKLMDDLAEIASASRKGRTGVNQLLDGATDLSDNLRRKIDDLPAASQRGAKPSPSGLTKTKSLPTSTKVAKAARFAAKAAAFGYGLYLVNRLMNLDDDEKACIEMCMPEQKETPQTFKSGPDPEALREGSSNVYCDGTEATGETFEDCEKYCVAECTSLENKCKILKIDWACKTGSGITNIFGEVFDNLLGALGLGNIGEVVKKIILGVIIFVGVMALLFVLRLAFKAKKVAYDVSGLDAPQPQPQPQPQLQPQPQPMPVAAA